MVAWGSLVEHQGQRGQTTCSESSQVSGSIRKVDFDGTFLVSWLNGLSRRCAELPAQGPCGVCGYDVVRSVSGFKGSRYGELPDIGVDLLIIVFEVLKHVADRVLGIVNIVVEYIG